MAGVGFGSGIGIMMAGVGFSSGIGILMAGLGLVFLVPVLQWD